MPKRYGTSSRVAISFAFVLSVALWPFAATVVSQDLPAAVIDGSEDGWRALTADDFLNVNCDEGTWRWEDGVLKCTGQPVGVIRSKEQITNFELVAEWMHEKDAGNSGIFVWVPPQSLEGLERGKLPHGIECQVLDPGYVASFEASSGRKADWFTGHGDVFPVGVSDMEPFPPVAPNGKRSFPSENRTKSFGEWNHYYIRCIQGEVRLWVNGREVSGGRNCNPRTGYLALESEGSPIQFRNLRIRLLPE